MQIDAASAMVEEALIAIRDKSKLNVRILTRSPLARKHFDLFKTFGNRLVFGMSLPTLNNRLAGVYEPKAPSPCQRFEMLKKAKEAGLHVFVAVAPTYPECDEADLRKTLSDIKKVDPITNVHEPINIRAENVALIAGGTGWPIMQCSQMLVAEPGQSFYLNSQEDCRTWVATLDQNYQLTAKLFADRCGNAVVTVARGNVYNADGNISVYDQNGRQIGTLETPQRASSLAFG